MPIDRMWESETSHTMSDTVVSSKPAGPPAEAAAPSLSAAVPGAEDPGAQEVVIRPRPGWIAVDWRELYRFRELMYFLVWRDIKVRYKQTVLGAAWAVLQPICYMIIFTVIFGGFLGVNERLPAGWQDKYPIFAYAGLLPWLFFANSVSLGGLALVNQQHLLTKIYLPRLFVPAASVGGALVDLCLSAGIFALLMIWYGAPLSSGLIFAPLLVLLTMLTALGVTFTLSALTVSYRDFRFIIPFLVQAWMFLSPVIYPVGIIPERYGWVLALNPMAGIIEAFRSAVLGFEWNLTNLAISSTVSVVLFVFGLFYFRKTERRFADIA
jgi:lipopolysaccharide transport system permease protein